jgi:hypothetical protein
MQNWFAIGSLWKLHRSPFLSCRDQQAISHGAHGNHSHGVHREMSTMRRMLLVWGGHRRKHEAPKYRTPGKGPKSMSKKILSISAFAAVLCLASVSAQAAEGCGRGEHRGPDGRCYMNGRVVVAPVVVVEPPVGVVCGPGLRWHPRRHRCWAY